MNNKTGPLLPPPQPESTLRLQTLRQSSKRLSCTNLVISGVAVPSACEKICIRKMLFILSNFYLSRNTFQKKNKKLEHSPGLNAKTKKKNINGLKIVLSLFGSVVRYSKLSYCCALL